MPRGNGTGPSGQGPKTGRGAGFCAGYDQPGFASGGQGRGMGQGMGRGMGRGMGQGGRGMGQGGRGKGLGMRRRNRFVDEIDTGFSAEEASGSELEMLKAQAESLEAASADIKERIAALEDAAKGDEE